MAGNICQCDSPLASVLITSRRIMKLAKHVRVDEAAIEKELSENMALYTNSDAINWLL